MHARVSRHPYYMRIINVFILHDAEKTKNDKANAVIWITQSACKEHTHSDDKDSIVGRKVKTVVTIYTLTPSLGALGNVNLGSHYEMYLNLTKN